MAVACGMMVTKATSAPMPWPAGRSKLFGCLRQAYPSLLTETDVPNPPADLSDRELADLLGVSEHFDHVPAEFWTVAREFLAAPAVTR